MKFSGKDTPTSLHRKSPFWWRKDVEEKRKASWSLGGGGGIPLTSSHGEGGREFWEQLIRGGDGKARESVSLLVQVPLDLQPL